MSKYKLEYLPGARNDMLQISRYIAQKLKAPQAARDLLQTIGEAIALLESYPYAHPIFRMHKPLKKETRLLPVKNFAVLYVVDEDEKIVEIQAIVYAKRDLENSSG